VDVERRALLRITTDFGVYKLAKRELAATTAIISLIKLIRFNDCSSEFILTISPITNNFLVIVQFLCVIISRLI